MKLVNTSIRFNKVITSLLFSHSFIFITLVGNAIVIGFSVAFYYIERAANYDVHSVLDAIWWGFSTATTVGYGDIIPMTDAGKILGIVLMLIGTALFATYTALFAQTILEDEFFRMNKIPEDIGLEKHDFVAELKKHKEMIDKQIKHYESENK